MDSEYQLKFDLTDKQKHVSHKLTEYVNDGKSVLLEAVCGAGKTEIIFEMVSDQLRKGRKVGFTIARRQVVIEIAERLSKAFTNITVIPVCQGYTSVTMADLVVCTTHQLYRYNGYFDVLIIDEPDAFPFKGNDTLKGIARHACKGSTVYLTATPDEELKNLVVERKVEYLYLSKRPHGFPLCEPEVLYGIKPYLLLQGILWLKKELEMNRKVLIFIPSKKLGARMKKLLSLFVSCNNIDSTSENKDQIIQDFKDDKYRVLFSTNILERGVTFSNVQVLVYKADNGVFDDASLTQISGRVGRNINYPTGDCLFLCESRQRSIDNCVSGIVRANND
ncbi:MAG: DEAD/DEAH box helicase family protein [Erysipelotrichaceae bacterium]|nr:DEAD/DEAH box helicase family protein [Erysipelotrichaceae bacterium]